MARTVQSILTHVKRRYPDIPQDEALRMLNVINRELHRAYPLAMTSVDIPLIEGEAVYEVPDIGNTEVSLIWGADYFPSPEGPGIPMAPGDMSLFAREWPGYREQNAPGPPRVYFQENTVSAKTAVRFLPPPSQEAAGNFVRLYVSVSPTVDLGINDSVPNSVPDDAYVYVTGICYLWARDRHPEAFPLREKLYNEEKAKLEAWLMRRIVNYKPRFYWPSQFRRDYVV
jgi:hypothetical protein